MVVAERVISEKPAIVAWCVGRVRRNANITSSNILQFDEARLELQVDGPMARAELVWPDGYGTRMLAYGPYSDVMERVIECGRYGVGCGPLASNRPHQWLSFEQDGSYRASTSRGELRLLPFLERFALVHVLTDGGIAWLSLHEDRREAFSSAFAAVGKTRPRPLTVRYRGQVLELTVASVRGVIAYCRLDPKHDLLLIPADDNHVELVIVGVGGDMTTTVAVFPVDELGHRDELWTDEPARPEPRSLAHAPPSVPRQAEVNQPVQVSRPESASYHSRRPPPIHCRCKVPVDVLERVRFRAHLIADLKPDTPNDPTGWARGLRRALAEGMVRLAARGRDIRGVGRELRLSIEKVLGCRLPGGARSFRYAIAAYRRYSRFIRVEGRQVVLVFSDLLRPDSELMRWLFSGEEVQDFGADEAAEEDDLGEEEGDDDAGDGEEEEEEDSSEVDPDEGDEEHGTEDGAHEAERDPVRDMTSYRPKFLFYTPKYYKDLYQRDRERRGEPPDVPEKKKARKKTPPPDS